MVTLVRFKPAEVKQITRDILAEKLQGAEYNPEQAAKWTQEIAKIIRDKIAVELKYDRYKCIVNVFIGEQKGAGVKYVKRGGITL